MSQYIVTTPGNPDFNGKTCGVRFERGRAFVSVHTINPALKWTVEQVVSMMEKDFGYEVVEVEDGSASAILDPSPAAAVPVAEARKRRAKREEE